MRADAVSAQMAARRLPGGSRGAQPSGCHLLTQPASCATTPRAVDSPSRGLCDCLPRAQQLVGCRLASPWRSSRGGFPARIHNANPL
eukprot:6820487-Prymnesium_polylepis.1